MQDTRQLTTLDLKLTYLFLVEEDTATLREINSKLNFWEIGITKEVIRRLRLKGMIVEDGEKISPVKNTQYLLWSLSDKRILPKEEEYTSIILSLPKLTREYYSLTGSNPQGKIK